jgi:hypothetical protein
MMTDNDLFTPHMPEVDLRPELDGIFDRARAAAAELNLDEIGAAHNQLIIVTPGRLLIAKDSPLQEDIPMEQLGLLGELVPPEPSINIAVIAYTYLDALKTDMRRAIPFIDFLLGFSAIGHLVWIFEGHQSALAAGCRDADLLLVDEAMATFLDQDVPDWRTQALAVMRGDTIRLVSHPSK